MALRIVHVEDVAGVGTGLAKAQRELGHDSISLTSKPNPFRNESDILCDYSKSRLQAINLLRHALSADVIHIHGGIRRSRWDLRLLSRLKPTVVHLHGSDYRWGYGVEALRNVDVIIAATPDIGGLYIPNPAIGLLPVPLPNGPIRFVHLPSNRKFKGTKHILNAAEKAGVKLEIIENVSHADAIRAMIGAHVVIDQFTPYNTHGRVSIEALSLGRVAVCSGDYSNSGLPIQGFTDMDSLVSLLKLLSDPEVIAWWAPLGPPSLKHLHPHIIANRHIAIYNQLVRKHK